MNFEIWFKFGSKPYKQVSLEELFEGQTYPPIVLCESQEEADILAGLQLVFGEELDIRIIEPESSVNPWTYNRGYLFYTFNPLERAFVQ